jgi:thioredoxin-related protein
MKKTVLTILGFWLAGQAMAADLPWLTSLPDALNQARAENKTVLMDFTGSDWCGWCKKLDAETFSKDAFADYAASHLVLVQVDFPRAKEQSDELKAANKSLQKTYGVSGYPTLVSLSADGSVLWKQVGYLAGGPAALISKLGGTMPKTAPASAPAQSVNLAAIYGGTPPAPKPTGEPKLQGIFWSAGHGSILLDGKSCEEGDTVRGMRVIKITRDKVTVQWQGQTKDLTM